MTTSITAYDDYIGECAKGYHKIYFTEASGIKKCACRQVTYTYTQDQGTASPHVPSTNSKLKPPSLSEEYDIYELITQLTNLQKKDVLDYVRAKVRRNNLP